MEYLIFFIILLCLLFFVIGFFNPALSLFWLNGNKTRIKSSVIYSILTLVLLILLGNILPSDENINVEEKKENITENSEENVKINKNIIEWNNNQAKIEKYIKKNIKGKWLQVYNLNVGGKKDIFTEIAEGESVSYGECEYRDKNNYTYKFINEYSLDKANEQYLQSGKYSLNSLELKILTSDNFNSSLTEKNYVINYISENLLIYSDKVVGSEATIYIFKKFGKSTNEIYSELLDYFSIIKENALQYYSESLDNYKINSNIKAFQLAGIGNGLLHKYAAIDTNYNINESMILKDIKELEKLKEQDIEEEYINLFKTKIDKLGLEENVFSTYEKYIGNFNPIFLEMIAIIVNGENLGLKFKRLKEYSDSIKRKSDKIYKEYSLYGNGDKYLMQYTAESAVKEFLNDPSSFKFVDGYPTNKRNSEGWVYYIKYRAKNVFGAYVLEEKNVLLRFSPEHKTYYTVNGW